MGVFFWLMDLFLGDKCSICGSRETIATDEKGKSYCQFHVRYLLEPHPKDENQE